ncbi:MAG: DUF5615 family PIN-like protein [Chromatiales bacterium]|nr:DUF5615 family PIN-like protein [Chromatiales bacterium]
MKLLFDHNLSHRLAGRLDDAFPESEHVRNVGLQEASDHAVWEYARSRGFAIVSKDEDFHQLSFLRGPPPKVVWVKLGNCTTDDVERVLRERRSDLLEFDDDEDAAFTVVVGGTR